MWIVAASFITILAIFVGLYWVAILRPEQDEARALSQRLRSARQDAPTERLSLLRTIIPLSGVPILETLLKRSQGGVRPLEDLVQQSGLKITVGQLVLGSVFLALVAFAAVLQFTGYLPGAGVAALVLGAVPLMLTRFMRTRRLVAFEEQFPEAIDLIARALRAGHALTTALGMVAEEAPERVRAEFRLLYDQQNYGMPLQDALRAFGRRVPLLDARFFVTAVLTQRESGGNLSEVLDSLAALIRERFRLKRQIRVMSAHGRITGWVLSALPIAVAGLLFVIAPQHISKLFTDPIGLRMVAGIAVLQVIGIVAMRRIVNIEI